MATTKILDATSANELLSDRVYRLLRNEISNGELAPGSRLPPERTLSSRLEVSRETVRRALKQLISEGLVESWSGRGSFVAGGLLSDPPDTYRSFTELGAEHGLIATAQVIARSVRPALLEEAEQLSLAPGNDLFELRRLRMLDALPIALDHVRVPLAKAPGLVDVDFTTASLYESLRAAGVPPVRGDYSVTAVAAEADDAELLDAPAGSPFLLVRSAGLEANGSVVELSETLYRGDRYRFRASLHRR
ncbi:MAG TPA: GntR family transcriptional regulator [Pseudolysinimonas sp.]|jgi:GntR family transcriptional regulator